MNLENMKIDMGEGHIMDIIACSEALPVLYKEGNLKAVQEYMFYIKEAMDKLSEVINNGQCSTTTY